MRRHIYDILSTRIINPFEEAIRLDDLFSVETTFVYHSRLTTLEDYIDDTCFRSLNLRGTFTNIKEMREYLKITRFYLNDAVERLLLLCEFLIAIITNSIQTLNMRAETKKQSETIIKNIMMILDKINYELQEIEDNKRIIVEKNKAASQAVELVTEEAIAINVIEYNHFQLKSDLQGKKQILLMLANYMEPILKSRKLSDGGFANLQSDLGFVLNNFNIRHNNKDGKKAQEYIVSLKDSELEDWYDKAYNMILAAIIVSEQIDINSELSEIKRNYRWVT